MQWCMKYYASACFLRKSKPSDDKNLRILEPFSLIIIKVCHHEYAGTLASVSDYNLLTLRVIEPVV